MGAKLYLDGYGFKQIAKKLNADGVHTPAYYQQTLLGKNVPHTWPQISKQQLWISTTIKRILENEFYAGTLICHKTRTDKINKTFRFIPPEEQYRHENAVPAIIDRETWQQAQFLLQKRVKDRVRAAPGQKIHRYTGIIECADCHSVCTARTRKLPQGGRRVEYICNTYHRYGKEYCTTHLIREEVLDDLVYKELLRVKKMAHANWEAIDALAKDWAAQKFNAERQIDRLQERISVLKNEVEQILMERIRDKAHADIYDVMLQKRDEAIQSAEQQINEYRDAQASLEARKESMRPGIDLLDAITSESSVSDAHLRMFVNKVYLHEQDGKLSVEFVLNADFQTHLDLYDQNGELTDVCNDLGYYTWLETLITETWLLYHSQTGSISPIVSQALRYIKENFSASVSIKEFCNQFDINASYLGYLFKTETGVFFNDYVSQVRINNAMLLLENTHKKIAEIAERVGFSNVSYFIKCFRGHTGISPAKYRQNKLAESATLQKGTFK